MNKEFSKELYIILIVLLLLAGIFFVTDSTFRFYNGFHNVDLSFNSCLVANDIGSDFRQLSDTYDVGKDISMIDLYIVGNESMRNSVWGFIGGGFLIAFSIMLLVQEKKNDR